MSLKLTNELVKKKSLPDCPICLRKVSRKKQKRLSCNHRFHWRCIDRWLKVNNSCPLCRKVTCKQCREKIHNSETDYYDSESDNNDLTSFEEIFMTLMMDTGYLSSPN